MSFFTYQDVSSEVVSVILAQSLEDLVDSESPQNVLKFRLVCDYNDGEDKVSFQALWPRNILHAHFLCPSDSHVDVSSYGGEFVVKLATHTAEISAAIFTLISLPL